jgi:glucan phosphoethanolaminetransferase (alkaline phosphatase superfamily)
MLATVVLVLAPAAPAALQAWQAAGQSLSTEVWGGAQALWLYLTLLLACLALCGRLRWALLLLVPAALLAPFEFFYIQQFRLPTGAHVYGVIADTDRVEALSWLGPWLVPMLLALAAWSGAVAASATSWWRADWRWRHRSRWWVLMAFAALLGGAASIEWSLAAAERGRPEAAPNRYLQHALSLPDDGILAQLEATYPWGLAQRLARFAEHQQALKAHRQMIAGFDFGVRWDHEPPAAQRRVHVMVIGETGRPDRWGLFGAGRDTTPRLSARSPQLLVFEDAVSAASATRESVPLMLTRRPVEAMLAPTGEPSVVSAFKQAGFRTYWLSTQGTSGAHETPMSVLAAEADERHFINPADYRGTGALDGDLLPLLSDILDRAEPKVLIVLHTLGSHLHYSHRHPPDFARFQPALPAEVKPDIWHPAGAQELRNAYDNSVLYTDHVLDRAIEMLDRSAAAATLLYAADHGETLFDGGCARAGHGFAAAVNYRVPMFVWASASWRAQRPDTWASLQQRRRQPVSTLAVFPTLTGLAGFSVAQSSAHQDLGRSDWTASARQLTHFGNFDRNVDRRSCDAAQAPARR